MLEIEKRIKKTASEKALKADQDAKAHFQEVDKKEQERITEFKEQMKEVKKPKDAYKEILEGIGRSNERQLINSDAQTQTEKELVQILKSSSESIVEMGKGLHALITLLVNKHSQQ